MKKPLLWGGLFMVLFFLMTQASWAQSFSMDFGSAVQGSGSTTARIMQVIAFTTVMALVPSVLLMVTCFTRFIIVLGLARTALGTQQSPPNQVLAALALFLTLFVMAPAMEQSWKEGISPWVNGKIRGLEALKISAQPFHDYMTAEVRPKDLDLFSGIAKLDPTPSKEVPYHVLIPAFMISELSRAFEIGFLLFIPFLVIDMIVASILMALGMMMLPPVAISIPFKIIFFVLVDGWYMLAGSLVRGASILPP